MYKCKCGNKNLIYNDNSINRLKDRYGKVEIYPIVYCKNCGSFYCDDGDGFEKISKNQIKAHGYKKWFDENNLKKHDQIIDLVKSKKYSLKDAIIKVIGIYND